MRDDLYEFYIEPLPPANLSKTLETLSAIRKWPLEIRYRTNGNVVVKMTDPTRDRSFEFTGCDYDEAVKHVCLEISHWLLPDSDRGIKPGFHIGATSGRAWERECPGSEIHSRIDVLNRPPGDPA